MSRGEYGALAIAMAVLALVLLIAFVRTFRAADEAEVMVGREERS